MWNFSKIKDVWQKYGVVIFLVTLVYAGYKTFAPAQKIIEYREDTKITSSLKSQISTLTSQVTNLKNELQKQININKNIETIETTKTVKKTDGTEETTTEKHTIDKSTSKTDITNKTESSTITTSSSSVITSSSTTSETKIRKKETTNPTPFWTSEAEYLFEEQQVILGQGINLGNNFTGMLLGSYSFNQKKFDYGAGVVLRY